MKTDEVKRLKLQRNRKSYVLFVAGCAILSVILGFKYILPLFFPFVCGYFIAWIAAPIVTYLTVRVKVPRGVSSSGTILVFTFVVGTILFLLGRAVFLQIRTLCINLPVYEAMITTTIDEICKHCDKWFHFSGGTMRMMIYDSLENFVTMVQTKVVPNMTGQAFGIAKSMVCLAWNIIIVLISALLIVKDFTSYKEGFQNSYFYKEIHMVTETLSDMGIAYFKAQFFMMCIIAGICTVGLLLLKNRYALLLGIGIGIFDAFPVLGSAMILIPWAVIMLIKKEFFSAAILFTIFGLCQLTRQMLEPKLVGDRIGIQPIYTLMSMYVGIKIYGVWGFILGPISLVAMKAIINAAFSKLNKQEE